MSTPAAHCVGLVLSPNEDVLVATTNTGQLLSLGTTGMELAKVRSEFAAHSPTANLSKALWQRKKLNAINLACRLREAPSSL